MLHECYGEEATSALYSCFFHLFCYCQPGPVSPPSSCCATGSAGNNNKELMSQAKHLWFKGWNRPGPVAAHVVIPDRHGGLSIQAWGRYRHLVTSHHSRLVSLAPSRSLIYGPLLFKTNQIEPLTTFAEQWIHAYGLNFHVQLKTHGRSVLTDPTFTEAAHASISVWMLTTAESWLEKFREFPKQRFLLSRKLPT